jgi:hypothetical protein
MAAVKGRGALLLLVAIVAIGCVERTPGHASGYFDTDSAVFEPPPDGGASDSIDAGDWLDGGGDAWAGTWAYVSGSQGLACGGSIAITATTGSLQITPAPTVPSLTVIDDGCTFRFDVVGSVASSQADQSCSAWAIPTIPTWTLTMQPDGTLREVLGGRLYRGGEICTISGGGTLARQ